MKSTTSNSPSFFQMIIIAILFGILAGLVSELFYQTYLGRDVLTNSQQPLGREIISDSVSSKEIENVKNRINAQVFLVDENIKNETFISANQVRAYGVMLTEDGWIATTMLDVNGLQVLADSQLYAIQDVIYDQATGVSYIKIETSNASYASLAGKNSILLGEPALIMKANRNVVFTAVTNERLYRQSLVDGLGVATNAYPTKIAIEHIEAVGSGSAVFNTRGEVIGLIDDEYDVIPSYQIDRGLDLLLQNENIDRPRIDIQYRQNDTDLLSQKRGAIVLSNSSSGLIQKNDTIIEVEGVRIDDQNSLSDVIQRFKPTDEIDITLERNKVSQTVAITLLGSE